MDTIVYANQEKHVAWQGITLADGKEFDNFMSTDVYSRLNDDNGKQAFATHLRSLATTGFDNKNLKLLLSSDTQEERDWAIGEALAEAFLSTRQNIIWPWNMERDKRTPLASLPGADLVGFEVAHDSIRLVLGEVKTSGDKNTPPNVMTGRSGMHHQLDRLANDLSLIVQLLRWLLPRCKGTEYETYFNSAVTLLLSTENKAIAFIGVLIRDTQPSERDLRARGYYLSNQINSPSSCKLIALYVPCPISSLRGKTTGELS